jgi:two-component system alkaline phosphatase synthesis response regulator PhoP
LPAGFARPGIVIKFPWKAKVRKIFDAGVMKERILIIEDDPDIAESLRYNLRREGFHADVAESGEKGFRLALDPNLSPSLIVLDLMLPGMSGTELCHRLRRQPATEKTPIIILTAKASESDKISGLELGADDYMTKPFSVKELLARIRAVLRRSVDEDATPPYNDGTLTIDFDDMRVLCYGEAVRLTRKEFALLSTLVKNQNRVATRQRILDDVWGHDYFGDTRTLDVHVRRLRQKLGECSRSIETVVGVGYRFIGNK